MVKIPNNTVNNAPTSMLMYTGIPAIEAAIAPRVIPVESTAWRRKTGWSLGFGSMIIKSALCLIAWIC